MYVLKQFSKLWLLLHVKLAFWLWSYFNYYVSYSFIPYSWRGWRGDWHLSGLIFRTFVRCRLNFSSALGPIFKFLSILGHNFSFVCCRTIKMRYCVRSGCQKWDFVSAKVNIFNCFNVPGKHLSVGPPVTFIKECPRIPYRVSKRVLMKNLSLTYSIL